MMHSLPHIRKYFMKQAARTSRLRARPLLRRPWRGGYSGDRHYSVILKNNVAVQYSIEGYGGSLEQRKEEV